MLAACGLLGFSGVGLGALGAHALRDRLNPDKLRAWNTAVQYQLLHTVCIFSVALATKSPAMQAALGKAAVSRLKLASHLWLAGLLMFSGSIYGLVLTEIKILGPITPIGGLAMMAGWLAVAAAAIA